MCVEDLKPSTRRSSITGLMSSMFKSSTAASEPSPSPSVPIYASVVSVSPDVVTEVFVAKTVITATPASRHPIVPVLRIEEDDEI